VGRSKQKLQKMARVAIKEQDAQSKELVIQGDTEKWELLSNKYK
jgi:hypothetical protein